MLKKSLIVVALAAAFAANAQTAPAPAAPAAANGAAASSPAKKELIARILKSQQGAIEALAGNLVQQPAGDLLQDAFRALQVRVAKDKQEQVAKEIQADARKYVEETVPLAQKRAVALAPTTVGAVLDEKFSEEELRQLVAIVESPVNIKFQRLYDEMFKSLGDKLVADTRGQIEPKLNTLEQTVAKRLGMTAPPTGAAPQGGPARGAAKPAASAAKPAAR